MRVCQLNDYALCINECVKLKESNVDWEKVQVIYNTCEVYKFNTTLFQ